MEDINNLDEAKILGYFETIRSNYLLKMIFLDSVLKEEDTKCFIDPNKFSDSSIEEVSKNFDDPIFFKALSQGNEELHLNFVEDMLTSLICSSWDVFEQIIKDLIHRNYATLEDDFSATYQNGKFQFSTREKKDIKLFYYLRNAIHHYNGAYFAGKDINHRYAGIDIESQNHYGEKIELSHQLGWKLTADLEKYTIKAWFNAKRAEKSIP
jgi:hypothetical protein